MFTLPRRTTGALVAVTASALIAAAMVAPDPKAQPSAAPADRPPVAVDDAFGTPSSTSSASASAAPSPTRAANQAKHVAVAPDGDSKVLAESVDQAETGSADPASAPAATPSSAAQTGVPLVQLTGWGDPAVAAAITNSQANAADRGVTQSIVVVDRGSAAAAQSDNADREIGAMSTIKLLIAAQVLHEHGGGKSGVPSGDYALLHTMITQSDNDAASALYARYGGRGMLNTVIARYGLSGTTAGSNWGSSSTTAHDLAQLLTDIDRDPQVGPAVFAEMSQTVAWVKGTRQDYGVDSLGGDRGAKQGYGYAGDGALLIHSAGYASGRIVVIMSWTGHDNLGAAYDASDFTARTVTGAA